MESKAFDKSISTAPTNFFWFKDILQLSIKPYGNMIGAIRFPKMIIPVKLKVKKSFTGIQWQEVYSKRT